MMYKQVQLQQVEIKIWQKFFNVLKKESGLDSRVKQGVSFLRKKIDLIMEEEEFAFGMNIESQIIKGVLDRIIGLGSLEDLLKDDAISEIMVNGVDNIFVEKKGCLQRVQIAFYFEKELLNIINKIVSEVGRCVDESGPMVDARLSGGSRVNVIIPLLSLSNPILIIRKSNQEVFTLDKLLDLNSITLPMKKVLSSAVRGKWNILIFGGIGTGKTSLLNALSGEIDYAERIITIKDSAELQLNHPHLVSLESWSANVEGREEIAIRELVRNSLRMRSDRIIVGEIRGAEVIDMLQAMSTGGHNGSIATVHVNAPLKAFLRLETMILMGDVNCL